MNNNVHTDRPGGITRFQRRVYEAAKEIPRGRVTTYKILAQYLSATDRLPAYARAPARELGQGSACGGKCGSCRAIGQALRRNPFAPAVPCHRVIASDLTIGGFSALGETSSKDWQGKKTGASIRRKLKLLETEGVKFRNGRLVNPALIYRFSEEVRIP